MGRIHRVGLYFAGPHRPEATCSCGISGKVRFECSPSRLPGSSNFASAELEYLNVQEERAHGSRAWNRDYFAELGGTACRGRVRVSSESTDARTEEEYVNAFHSKNFQGASRLPAPMGAAHHEGMAR